MEQKIQHLSTRAKPYQKEVVKQKVFSKKTTDRRDCLHGPLMMDGLRTFILGADGEDCSLAPVSPGVHVYISESICLCMIPLLHFYLTTTLEQLQTQLHFFQHKLLPVTILYNTAFHLF